MSNLLIVWNDADNLGIDIIDDQHRGIVSIINSFYYAMRQGRGNEVLNSIYNMIREYSRLHFATEEEILTKTGYPRLKAHRELHAELIVKTLYIGSESLLMNDPVSFLEFLKNWWLDHIRRQDSLYAEHVKKSLHLL